MDDTPFLIWMARIMWRDGKTKHAAAVEVADAMEGQSKDAIIRRLERHFCDEHVRLAERERRAKSTRQHFWLRHR